MKSCLFWIESATINQSPRGELSDPRITTFTGLNRKENLAPHTGRMKIKVRYWLNDNNRPTP